jgi:autotransporter-associated beta strand protein
MNTQSSRNSVQPTIRNLRKNFLPLLLAVAGVVTGGSVGFGAVAFDADFSAYTLGTLNGQNSWVKSGALTTEIQVIAAAASVPQSMKFTGSATAAPSYRDLPVASQFNPYGVTSPTTFYYVIENFRVLQAQNSSTGTGAGVCNFTLNAGGSGTYFSRLYVRRYGGVTANTATFDLGMSASGSTAVYGSTAFAINTSYKVVVAYVANPTGTSDVVKVYVNPVGQDPATWTPEVTQNATEPTSSTSSIFKSFLLTPASVANSTQNGVTMGRIIVGDSAAEVVPLPAAPTSLPATTPGVAAFTANWATASGATGYNLDVATDSGFTSHVSGYPKSVGAVTTYSVTGPFAGGTTLYYKVQASNSAGNSAYSLSQSVAITAASFPTVSNGTASGTVTWQNGPGWSPNNPVSATDASVTFNGALSSGTLTANNDSTGNFQLNSLVFANTGTGTINVTGNPFQLSSNGTTNPTITFANNANLTQQISNPLQLQTNLTVTNATTATLDGAISGTGALSKSGAGALRFNASNSYAGGTTISAGTLMLANDNALGSGALNIGTSTTLSITNGSKNIPNPVVFLANYTSSLGGLQKVDWTNQLSGNISGPGVVRINTVYLTAYLSNPTNSFDSVLIGNGAIAANSFGVAGSPSPLGTNGTINFANSGVGVLKYLGSGETNAKTLAFAAGPTFTILENRGTGPVKFTSPLQILRTAANTLILEPFAPGSGEFAASVTNLAGVNVAVDGTRLAKSGTGDWILSASNDYRNTSVQDGRLIAQHPNALPANRDVEMAGGTLLVNYSGTGATLGNLCLTNYKSSVNRYIDTAVDPETYKFNDSTINLGTNRAATLVFSSATNWIVNQLTDPVTTTTYGRNQYLKVANSAVGAGLYITNTNGVDLSRILCAENTNLTAKITYSKRLIFVGTQTTPTITVLPTAAAITYGQTLANSALTGGSVSVPGTFEFTSPATAPIAGTATYQVIFIPSDETLYNTVTTTVSVTVNKANRTVTFPTAAAITYGQALGSATLTGGSTEGAFAFSAPASVPSAGVAQNFQVVFTPTDEVNYNYDKLTQQVAVTVNKADSTITVNPTGAAITVGQALSSSVLSGGSATDNNGVSLPGTFTWTEASSTPAEGSGSYLVTFTPDSANYKTASGTASVTVNPAPIGPTFATAFGGVSATALGSDGMANLLRYALGANSPSGSVVKPVSALDANSLSITAIVRINDPKVTVVGESATDLTAWNTTPIVGVSTADQTGAISGETQKQSFSVPRGPTKTFLRLKATQAN